MIEKNARISSTSFGIDEDHGIMTAWLYLDYGGSGQGCAGNWVLDTPFRSDGKFVRRVGTAAGLDYLLRILRTLDVLSWEKLPGTPCRVRVEDEWSGKVLAIGHYLKDQWLDFEEHFALWKGGFYS